MDIERMKKLLNSGIEAGHKVKEVREVVKTYTTQKQDMYDDTAEILKPSIDAQKSVKESIDKKQDQLITQLKENQEKIVKSIEFNPKKPITWKGEKLPALDWDCDESEDVGEDDGEDEEVKPSTSKEKPQFIDIDKGITDEYIKFLNDKELPKPSEIFNKGLDPNEMIKKVNNKIKRSKEYIESHSTKKGQPYKKLKKIQLATNNRNKVKLPYLEDYLVRLQHIQAAPKYIGHGIYTQKKRNAYKISQKGQYGGLFIDIPKL